MRLGVDVDGVLFDFHGAACHLLNVHKGYHLRREDVQEWDYIPRMVGREDYAWLFKPDGGIEAGLFRFGHIIKSAIEGIHAIRDMGHELVIITHRPAVAVQDTLDWLSYCRFKPAEVRILSDESPKTNVAADVYIDDKPETISAVMLNTGAQAIIFDQAWNHLSLPGDQDATRFYRAHGWDEVFARIESLG